jgi:hypothetical protein
MPNWCQNIANITHEDLEKLDAIVEELKKEEPELFNSLVPNPAGEWQYDWCVENWGTKWDASVYNYELKDGVLTINFDTAWGPPIAFYEKIEQMGFFVDAYYREEGMAFCGHYFDGSDEFYEYGNMSADEIEENIPVEIDEMFGISQYQRDCEAEEEDWDAAEALDDIVASFNAENEPKGSQVNTPEGREWLRGVLRSEKVKITFTKKDGTEREMLCTLANDKIPSEHAPKNTGKTQSDDAIAVFDLENDGWRSFRWDSVKKIEFTLGD